MVSQDHSNVKKSTFVTLWFLCIFGSLAVLPYVQQLGIIPSTVPILTLVAVIAVQSMVLFGLICWLCYLIIPKTDLTPFKRDEPYKHVIFQAVLAGLLAGGAVYLIDLTVFSSSLLSGTRAPFWAGFLASFYGAINEEVFLRLFLFTLVYYLFGKFVKFEFNKRQMFLWVTNIIVAIIFGLGHLPAAFKLTAPNGLEIFRILLLNGLPGLVFGWLYWSRGLWAAMTAHFMADLVLHVI